MTDIDTATINDRLAREVMGWTLARDYLPNHLIDWWNPCAYVEQMELCWQRMEEKGYNTAADCHWIITEEGIGERYYSRFLWKEGPDNRFSGAGDNEALVGCQVMIAALTQAGVQMEDAEKGAEEGKCPRS